ncbi:MAG: hypothetical protein L3J79_03635, partial [Candidatus Marinimicrobia bacterium]|nr:hypothetical protein [Candidatus Neomarinimicrobiota bacterium]
MTNIFSRFVLLPALLIPLLSFGTIINAEYYFDDQDAGEGNNTSIFVDSDGNNASLTDVISTETVSSNGIHTVSIRFEDDVYGWGPAKGIAFLVFEESTTADINLAEYFIDTDAGPGLNNDLTVAVFNGVASINSDVPYSDLGVGIHVMYVRFYQEDSGWGPARGFPFAVLPTQQEYSITSAEYFIDEDAGVGLNTVLSLEANGPVVSLAEDVFAPADLQVGLHALFVRFFSPETGWGPPASKMFRMAETGETQFVAAAQYYVGNPLNPTTVENALDGSFDEAQEAVQLLDVPLPGGLTGVVPVGIRFQAHDGFWGPWRTSEIFIQNEAEIFTISAAEYFFDNDPGAGLATAIEAPIDGQFDEATEEFNLPAPIGELSEGLHTVFLRLRKSNGFWGPPSGSDFRVTEDAQPTIAAAEYFVDPGTAEGSGIAFSPLDGAFNTTEESVEAIANMASLNAQETGNYNIYVRFQNSRGAWGAVNSQPFTVETRP